MASRPSSENAVGGDGVRAGPPLGGQPHQSSTVATANVCLLFPVAVFGGTRVAIGLRCAEANPYHRFRNSRQRGGGSPTSCDRRGFDTRTPTRSPTHRQTIPAFRRAHRI